MVGRNSVDLREDDDDDDDGLAVLQKKPTVEPFTLKESEGFNSKAQRIEQKVQIQVSDFSPNVKQPERRPTDTYMS